MPTPNLGLTKPTIGDTTVWGTQLNTDLDLIDAAAVPAVVSVSANTSLSYSGSSPHTVVLATGGNAAPGITLTLPTAVGHGGSTFTFKRLDSGSYNAPVILAFTSGQVAEGQATISMWHQFDEISLQSNGTDWSVISARGGPVSVSGGGVNEIDTTVAHDSTYPVAFGKVLKAIFNNGTPYADAGPYGAVISTKSSGIGAFYTNVGAEIHAEHNGSGAVQRLIGIKGECWNRSTGAIAEFMAGVTSGLDNLGGGPIVTALGFFADYNNTTNITNFAALFIAPTAQAFTGIVNAWSVYAQNGSSFFGGPIYLGVDASGASKPALASFSNPSINSGAGSPEGVVTARVGSIYMRSNGGANTSFYVKESGTGNTGWIAK